MSSKKQSYADKTRCPIALALDLFGDRWTLLVVRDVLLFDKHEFREFLDSEEKIATNILSDRLKRLVSLGILVIAPHPDSKLKKRYFLTAKGIALSGVIAELANWSAEYHDGVPAEIAAGMRQSNMDELHTQFRARAEMWLEELKLTSD